MQREATGAVAVCAIIVSFGRPSRVPRVIGATAKLWRRRGNRQDAGHFPAVWRLDQHLIHQEPCLLRRLTRCAYGEDDWDVDLRYPIADHGYFQARRLGIEPPRS